MNAVRNYMRFGMRLLTKTLSKMWTAIGRRWGRGAKQECGPRSGITKEGRDRLERIRDLNPDGDRIVIRTIRTLPDQGETDE